MTQSRRSTPLFRHHDPLVIPPLQGPLVSFPPPPRDPHLVILTWASSTHTKALSGGYTAEPRPGPAAVSQKGVGCGKIYLYIYIYTHIHIHVGRSVGGHSQRRHYFKCF